MDPEQMMLTMQLTNRLMMLTAQFATWLFHQGCRCEWGPAEELYTYEIVHEVDKPWWLRDHQMLVLIDETLQNKIDYHFDAIGRRIDHEPRCKAMLAMQAPLN